MEIQLTQTSMYTPETETKGVEVRLSQEDILPPLPTASAHERHYQTNWMQYFITCEHLMHSLRPLFNLFI